MSEPEPAERTLRVVGICGSLRPGSFTRTAVKIALRGAEEAGARTQLIDLRGYSLIFCDGKEDESRYPEDIFKDRNLEQRLLEVGRQVARFACLHSAERAMEFLKNWECAPVNPGGAAKAL